LEQVFDEEIKLINGFQGGKNEEKLNLKKRKLDIDWKKLYK